MTSRLLKVKGTQLSYRDFGNTERLLTGSAVGGSFSGNLKVKGNYLHYMDNSSDQKRLLGVLTGNTGTAGKIKNKGDELYYIDHSGNERRLSTITTYYTDAASVDGEVRRSFEDGQISESFSTIRNGAGTNSDDSSSPMELRVETDVVEDKWDRIKRILMLFPTTDIPVGAVILSVGLYIHITSHADQFTQTYAINVYSSNPASDTALIAADYGTLGTTPFATEKAISTLVNGAWTSFALNAAGRAAIIKGGITKLGLREANFDAPNNTPSWQGANLAAAVSIKTSENPDSTKRPYLKVTYIT